MRAEANDRDSPNTITGRFLYFFIQPWRIFKSYRRAYVRPDLIAGLTVAALAIPQVMAYAVVVDLPPEVGLYSLVMAVMAAALWGSSWHLSSGPTNATSLLVLSILLSAVGSAAAHPGTYLLAASLLALMAGLFRIVLAYLRFGALVTLASRSVLLGFTAGAGVLIALGQLKHLLRLPVPSTANLFSLLGEIGVQAEASHLPSVAFGLGSLAFLVVAGWLLKRWPVTFLAVVGAAGVVWFFGLDRQGLDLLGELPRKLPPFLFTSLADVPSFSLIRQLIVGAMAVAALGLIEAMAAAQSAARESGQHLDNDQEFFGQGMANLFAGLFSGYPADGSLTRTALNQQSGARSQMSGVFCGLIVLAAMLLLAPMARFIPKAALSAVLFVVAYKMIDRQGIRRVLATSREESAIMAATFLATLTLPLEFAVLSGVVLSLAFFVIHSSLPRVFQVVPDPTFRHFLESEKAPVCPQVGVVTIRGPLFFGAVHHVEEALLKHLERYPGQNHLVIRMHGVDLIDLTGIEMLEGLVHHHRALGGDLFLIRLRRPVQELMEESGFMDLLGRDHILAQEEAIGHLFTKVIDPAVCVYECTQRVFAECQAVEKHAYDARLPAVTFQPLDPAMLLDVDQARDLLASKNPLLLDLREPQEYARGHLPNAELLPLRQVVERAPTLPRDRPLLLVCRSGRRSRRGMGMLLELGFTQVFALRGGSLSWLASGLPLTSGQDKKELSESCDP